MICCLLKDKSRVLPRLRKRGVAPAKKTGCCPGYAREVLPLLADIWLRRRGVAPRSKNSKESTKFHRVGGSAQHINMFYMQLFEFS